MTKTGVSILSALLTFFIFNVGCYKAVTKAGNQRDPSRWEVLTESPIGGDLVPVAAAPVFFDESNGIAEHVVKISRSADGGKTWDFTHSFNEKTVQALVMTDDHVAWLVGSDKDDQPFVINSRDRGLSWQEVVLGIENLETSNKQFTTFNDICFTSPEKGWIAGDAGILETLTDVQRLKAIGHFFPAEEMDDVSCGENGEVWAVGRGGYVYHFQNGWDKRQINKSYTFRAVKLTGDDIWLLGYQRSPQGDDISGILLRSKDKGATWEDKAPETIEFFSDLHLEKGEGWLVGSDGNIYYSDDDGDTWKKFKSPTRNNLEHIYFLDKKNIWIGGINQTILKFKTN